jgi:hypothetical protein
MLRHWVSVGSDDEREEGVDGSFQGQIGIIYLVLDSDIAWDCFWVDILPALQTKMHRIIFFFSPPSPVSH